MAGLGRWLSPGRCTNNSQFFGRGMCGNRVLRDLKISKATGRADTFTSQLMPPGEEEEEEELTPGFGDLTGTREATNAASPWGFLRS